MSRLQPKMLANALRDSGLAHGVYAAHLLEDPRCPIELGETGIESSHLLEVYSWRAEYLANKRGHLAAWVRTSVLELCDRLPKIEDHCNMVLIGPLGQHRFVVFSIDSTGDIVGCLRDVTQLNVDSEEIEEFQT